MKVLLLFACLLVSITGCHQRFPDERDYSGKRKLFADDQTVRESLTDVWINTTSFCQNDSVACAEKRRNLQRELNDTDPVPVPQSWAAMPMTAAEATTRYKSFVAAHQGEAILALFQQLYPRILLNKYKIISGHDYELIAYYADQLAEAGALDFDTRTNALTVLNGHIPSQPYQRLLLRTIDAADKELIRQRVTITELRKQIAAQPKKFDPMDVSTYDEALCYAIIRRRQSLPTSPAYASSSYRRGKATDGKTLVLS